MACEADRILDSIASNAVERLRITGVVEGIYTALVRESGTVKNKSVTIGDYESSSMPHTYTCDYATCAYTKTFDSGKKGSKQERAFRKHILDHTRPKMFCPRCNYHTTGKQQLNQHIRRKHSTCSYTCPHASCSFADPCSMYGNVQIHYGRKHIPESFKIKTATGYICSKCRSSFSNSQTFHSHLAKCVGPFTKIGSGGSRKTTGMDLRSIFAC